MLFTRVLNTLKTVESDGKIVFKFVGKYIVDLVNNKPGLQPQKLLACIIDFMYALSTFTNQVEVLKNTQKSASNSQLKEVFSSGSIDIGMFFWFNRIVYPLDGFRQYPSQT